MSGSDRQEPSRPYPYHLAVRATLRDTDALGHVNNACYVTWMEEIRNRYVFERRGLTSIDAFDFILARTEIDYRSPVLLHEIVDLYCGPTHVGEKSWTFAYEGRVRGDGRPAFEAIAICVQFDFAANRSIPIPEAFRAVLKRDRIEPRA